MSFSWQPSQEDTQKYITSIQSCYYDIVLTTIASKQSMHFVLIIYCFYLRPFTFLSERLKLGQNLVKLIVKYKKVPSLRHYNRLFICIFGQNKQLSIEKNYFQIWLLEDCLFLIQENRYLLEWPSISFFKSTWQFNLKDKKKEGY